MAKMMHVHIQRLPYKELKFPIGIFLDHSKVRFSTFLVTFLELKHVPNYKHHSINLQMYTDNPSSLLLWRVVFNLEEYHQAYDELIEMHSKEFESDPYYIKNV